MSTRFIFITGGVSSSLGKGLASAALGALLQARGFSVILRKLDPYLNIDPGTMSPHQHGEVFVTEDGTETDLDIGHYERFTGVNARACDCTTTGKIYSTVLSKERRGDYLGATVQVVPHITDEIKRFITCSTDDSDFVLCEIGGTVGDIEGLPFLEAIRQLKNELGNSHVMIIHLTLLPYIPTAGELKTKPTQHSVKELLSVGIQPDLLLCRSDREISEEAKKKLSLFCNVASQRVIAALDADNIYRVPLQYHGEGFDAAVCAYFSLPTPVSDDVHQQKLAQWQHICDALVHTQGQVRIGIVGKYMQLRDAYKSLIQAITHGGIAHKLHIEIVFIDAEDPTVIDQARSCHGLIIPGGYGERGTQGKIDTITYARTQGVPILGICFGMQLMVIEACRSLLGLTHASSTEFGATPEPVIGLMTEWAKENDFEQRSQEGDLGGTMRLGSYPCQLTPDSLVARVYGQTLITERHRHRYEVNLAYRERLEAQGILFSGLSPDGRLPEIIEDTRHPWMIGVQFHPELKSRPFDPHPLFTGLIAAAYVRANPPG